MLVPIEACLGAVETGMRTGGYGIWKVVHHLDRLQMFGLAGASVSYRNSQSDRSGCNICTSLVCIVKQCYHSAYSSAFSASLS